MKIIATAIALLVLVSPLLSQDSVVYKFGVFTTKEESSVHAKYDRALNELSGVLTKSLGTEVHIDLVILEEHGKLVTAFANGAVDIVRVCPTTYVLIKAKLPKLNLLAIEQKKKVMQGVVVVREDSPIKSLADLKGQRFAFGDLDSTRGRYLAQAALFEAGLVSKDLRGHSYLGGNSKVFKAVAAGSFAGGAMKSSTFKKMNKKSSTKLRALHTCESVTKPWIARPGLSKRFASAFKEALLDLNDKKALKGLKVEGMAPVRDSYFARVRKAMESSKAWDGVGGR